MTEAVEPLNLLLPALVALAIIGGAVRCARSKQEPGPIAIFLVGGGLSWLLGIVFLLVRYPQDAQFALDLTRSFPSRIYWWTSSGLFWLLLFYALRSKRLATWSHRIGAVVAVVLASTVYDGASNVIYEQLFNLQRFASWSSLLAQFSNASSVGISFLFSALQVWITSAWIRSSGQRFDTLDAVRATGLKGVVMSKVTNQSTRLLCASVLLGHGNARQVLLGWLKDKNRAVALELGLDLRLAAQVARFAEKRQRRGWWMYFAIFCASLIVSFISIYAGVLGVIAAAIVWLVRHAEERNSFAPMFSLERFDPEEITRTFPADLEGEDIASLPYSDQNFFVYGGFMPFIGAGGDLGGWSVAIALDKPKETFGSVSRIEPFEIRDIYAAIDGGLEGLNVKGIERKDCFFACGTDVRGNSDLLPNIFGRPVQHLDDAVSGRYLYTDDEKVRHYRGYRILDWGGELALSYYIRASRRGNTLFVETRRFILTPLASSYRAVDGMVPMDWRERIGIAIASVFAGPILTLVSPLWAFAEISRSFGELFSQEDLHRRELIEKSPLFNYGATTSLRQALSSGVYGHYFQKMDGDLYNKLFEREVLDSLIEFLDSCGIDTSDLRERQTTILNTGVMVQGGDVNAESLSVGPGSRAIKKVQNALAPKAEAKGAAA